MMNDFDKPSVIILSEKSIQCTINDLFWIPCSAKFITLEAHASSAGVIQIHEITDGQITSVKEILGEKAFRCGTFGASSLRNRHLATGDFCGNLDIWDIERSSIPIYSVPAHKGIIQSIDGFGGASVGCGAPEIVTGSHDGCIKIWDPRQKEKPVVIIEPEGDNSRQCWAVAFGNSYNSQERIVCGGFDNGDIKMFDLRTMKIKWETTLNNGVCCIEFDRKDIPMNKFVVTGLEGMVCLFETRRKDDKFNGIVKDERNNIQIQNATIWCCRHAPQNRDIFVTGGGSGTINLWNYSNCNDDLDSDSNGSLHIVQKTSVSTQPVNSFSWSPDKFGLAVCSAYDQTVRLLYISKLNQI